MGLKLVEALGLSAALNRKAALLAELCKDNYGGEAGSREGEFRAAQMTHLSPAELAYVSKNEEVRAWTQVAILERDKAGRSRAFQEAVTAAKAARLEADAMWLNLKEGADGRGGAA